MRFDLVALVLIFTIVFFLFFRFASRQNGKKMKQNSSSIYWIAAIVSALIISSFLVEWKTWFIASHDAEFI